MSRKPELTVAVLPGDDKRQLYDTLASLLGQESVSLEVLVIHRPSAAEASSASQTPVDSRLRWIEDTAADGKAACLDLAVEASDAPYVAFVEPGDRLLESALRTLVNALRADPTVALAHCWWFEVDEQGRANKLALRERERLLSLEMPANLDHRWALIERGNFIQGVPTYRREALALLPRFAETGGDDPAYGMALRLLAEWEVRIVPQLLCCRPRGQGATARSEGRSYLAALSATLRLKRTGEVPFLDRSETPYWRAVASGLRRHLEPRVLREAGIWFHKRAYRLRKGDLPAALTRRFGRGPLYEGVVNGISWWPIGLRRRVRAARAGRGGRLAYVLWHYPILSETFIQREIAGLQRSAMEVNVFADASDSSWLEPSSRLPGEIFYIEPTDLELSRRLLLSFLRRKPLTFLNLLIYVVSCRYLRQKTLWIDLRLFRKAVHLAGLLEQRGVTHVHAPWADAHGFLALVASRLLGISYSVQARAHDIHSRSFNLALRENVDHAQFVVTNSRYNEGFLRPILGKEADDRLHTVYNGIDLARFPLPAVREVKPDRLRILSVGRLVQQKGFDTLIRACRILADRGLQFRCEIIGGAAWSLDANTYVGLQKLRRALELEELVSFLGPLALPQVLEAYQVADIFTLPCVVSEDGGHDVTPNALIEAMAFRLPVISTPVGAVSEIVEHGISGLLVGENDPEALAGGLEVLMENPELRRTFGEAGRRLVERRFDSDRNIRRYIELFRSMGVA